MKPSFSDLVGLALAGFSAGYLICAALYRSVSLWWLSRTARKDPKRYTPGEPPRGRARHG